LGAFMMGSIIAETTSAEKVEHVTKPIKDMFGAVFFVSVGMMIDPQAIVEYAWPVLCVTLLTLFGKLISTTAGALLSGQPLRQSVQVGMSMAQIGEFAFIVATLGLSLGVISDFLFPVAVGASAITTFTTPYLIKLSDPAAKFLEKNLPKRWIKLLDNYSTSTLSIKTENAWEKVIKANLLVVTVNIVVIISLMFFSLNFLIPLLHEKIGSQVLANLVGLVFSLAFASPFLWALMAKRINTSEYNELWLNRRYRKGPLFIVDAVRVAIGLGLISVWVFKVLSIHPATFIAILIIVILVFRFGKRIGVFYERIERRFIGNLNARERAEYNTVSASVLRKNAFMESELSMWDAHIERLEVPLNAAYIGRRLYELSWRENYGVNVVYIKRGENLIPQPTKESFILPGDEIGIIATKEQMELFKPMFESAANADSSFTNVESIVLQKFHVSNSSGLKGMNFRQSGIREATGGLIVAIERNNQRLLNPESTTVFMVDDIVWIVGDNEKITLFLRDRN